MQVLGHYSPFFKVGGFLFFSGQISIDPSTNEVQLFDGDLGRQTELVLKNISSLLHAQNLSLTHVVKTTIFLTDMSQFSKVNDVYARHFGNHKPARTTVEVSKLPKGVGIEIEVIAVS